MGGQLVLRGTPDPRTTCSADNFMGGTSSPATPYLCKIASHYAFSSKRKFAAFASAVIIAIVLHTKAAKKAMQLTCVELTVDP